MTVNKSTKSTKKTSSSKSTSATSTSQQTSKSVSKVSSQVQNSSKGNVSKSSSASSLQIADVSHLPVNASNVTYTVTEVLPAGGGEKITTYGETGGATSTEYRHFIEQDKSSHSSNIQQIESVLNQSSSNLSIDSASTYTVTEPKEEYRLTYNVNDSGWNGKFVMEADSSTASNSRTIDRSTQRTSTNTKNLSQSSTLNETFTIDNKSHHQDSHNTTFTKQIKHGSNEHRDGFSSVNTSGINTNRKGTSSHQQDSHNTIFTKQIAQGSNDKSDSLSLRDTASAVSETNRKGSKTHQQDSHNATYTKQLKTSSTDQTDTTSSTKTSGSITREISETDKISKQYSSRSGIQYDSRNDTMDTTYTIVDDSNNRVSSQISEHRTSNEQRNIDQRESKTSQMKTEQKSVQSTRSTTGWNGKFVVESQDNSSGASRRISGTTKHVPSGPTKSATSVETYILSEINDNTAQNQTDGSYTKKYIVRDKNSRDTKTDTSEFILTEIYDNVEKHAIRDDLSVRSDATYTKESIEDLQNSRMYTKDYALVDNKNSTDRLSEMNRTFRQSDDSRKNPRPISTTLGGIQDNSTYEYYDNSSETVDYRTTVTQDSKTVLDDRYRTETHSMKSGRSRSPNDNSRKPSGSRKPVGSPYRRRDSSVSPSRKPTHLKTRGVSRSPSSRDRPKTPTRRGEVSPSSRRDKSKSNISKTISDISDIRDYTTTVIEDSTYIIDEKYISDKSDVTTTVTKGPHHGTPSPTRRSRNLQNKELTSYDTYDISSTSYDSYTDVSNVVINSQFDKSSSITENIIEQEISRDIRQFENEIHKLENKLNETSILEITDDGPSRGDRPIKIIDAVEHVDIKVSDIISQNEEKIVVEVEKDIIFKTVTGSETIVNDSIVDIRESKTDIIDIRDTVDKSDTIVRETITSIKDIVRTYFLV